MSGCRWCRRGAAASPPPPPADTISTPALASYLYPSLATLALALASYLHPSLTSSRTRGPNSSNLSRAETWSLSQRYTPARYRGTVPAAAAVRGTTTCSSFLHLPLSHCETFWKRKLPNVVSLQYIFFLQQKIIMWFLFTLLLKLEAYFPIRVCYPSPAPLPTSG